MIPRFPVYVFDVDGTLMDSAADICGAIQQVLQARGLLDVTDAFLRQYIGRHLFDTFHDLGFPEPEHEAMLAEYRGVYLARGHSSTRPYPGVAEALAALGGRKSTATTKSTPTTRAVLTQFGLVEYFDHVQGTDGFPAKPAPDVVLRTLTEFGVAPEEVLFVGDAPADMEAGRRAGVRTCAVRYGYGSEESLAAWDPDFWIGDLRELVVTEPV